MSIKMIRIDDRLIHGQIVTAWAKNLQIKKIWIADDGVAKDDFIKGLKGELRNDGISYRDFTVTGNFYELTTVMDTLKNNVFIPTSGKSTALVKILPQLTQIRREMPHYNMNLKYSTFL